MLQNGANTNKRLNKMDKKLFYRKFTEIMVLVMLIISGSVGVYAGLDDWTMFRHDRRHTGESTSTGPETSKVLWSYTTGDDVPSSPAVANGRV